MATVLSFLAGLTLLLLGLCGGLVLCSDCSSAQHRKEAERRRQVQEAADAAVHGRYHAQAVAFFPERAEGWARATLRTPESLSWIAEYRDEGYEREAAFLTTGAADGSFQEEARQRLEAAQRELARRREAGAPNQEVVAADAQVRQAQRSLEFGRKEWGQRRLGAHVLVVRLDLFVDGRTGARAWLSPSTPVKAPGSPLELATTLKGSERFTGVEAQLLAGATHRHQVWLGPWQTPEWGAPTPEGGVGNRAVRVTVWGPQPAQVEAFRSHLTVDRLAPLATERKAAPAGP